MKVKSRAGRIIAVGGGKGGVGKTVFTANLALSLAARGYRTLLVDADLGGANSHTVLGVPPPQVSLSDFIGRRASLDEVAVTTPYPNLRLISGALDDVNAGNVGYQQKMRLIRNLGRTDTDFLLLDLGAGTTFNILDFFLMADDGILVVLPEPTSIENAYRFLKGAFMRRLRAISLAQEIKDTVDAAMAHRNDLGISTPADLMRVIEEQNPEIGGRARAQMASFEPRLIVNQVRDAEDLAVASDMASACRRFFGINLKTLGALPADAAVRDSVRRRQPYFAHAPQSQVAQTLAGIVDTLAAPLLQEGRAA